MIVAFEDLKKAKHGRKNTGLSTREMYLEIASNALHIR
jgi:hypothetical protein